MVSIRMAEHPQKPPSGANKYLEQIQSKGYFGFYAQESWTPAVNLYETEGSYLVCVDLAGVEKKKIEIEVADGQLVLHGNRATPSCGSDGEAGSLKRMRIHLMEIDSGAFSRRVELPENINRESINARYDNGLLWIEIPKN